MAQESNAANVIEWISSNWHWVSGATAAFMAVLYKIHKHFSGLNRLADHQAEITEEIRQIKDKQKKMVDAEGVDARVKPVIDLAVRTADRVEHTAERVDKVYDHLMSSK